MIAILIFIAYTLIGSALGGLYFYLRYKHFRDRNLGDIHFLSALLAAFWPILAPFAFAVYLAERIAEREEE